MPPNQPTDAAESLREIRRLLAEREAKQREIDDLDRAIARAAGMADDDRPDRQRLSRSDFRNLCRITNERIPKKKRPALDCGLA